VVVPRLEPPHMSLSGFSALSHQGAIWVGPRARLQMVDILVHEQSHVKQRHIEDTADLLDPEQALEVFRVGWRPDPRPLAGIYEGVYVNLHVCEALGRIAACGLVGPAEREQLLAVRRGHAANIREALVILAGHARFTPAGSGFLDWAETWTQRFEAVAETA
jgi:HEXXH motif-containing protein